MNRRKNHMQYCYFFPLGNTGWVSNGHMAIKKEVLNSTPIRYSKRATDNHLYKLKDDLAMRNALDKFKQYLAVPRHYIPGANRTLLKPPLDKSCGYLWRIWLDHERSYIFDADFLGFALHRLKGQSIDWALGVHTTKSIPKYSWGVERTFERQFLFLMRNKETLVVLCNIIEDIG